MATLKANAQGLIPTELSNEIVKGVQSGSTVMQLSKLEPMTAPTKKISVLNGLSAYFVDEGQKINSDDAQFDFVTLETKKLAVIVPFSNELVNNSIVDVFEEIKPEIETQLYRKFDHEAINGTSSMYAKSLLGVVNGTGKAVTIGDTAQGLHDDFSDTMGLVEEDGYEVNGFVTYNGMKNKLRKLKDNQGTPLYVPSVTQSAGGELYGQPVGYSFGVDKTATEAITGDFRYSVVGVRGDIEYKLLEEATVGNVNLAEQDMVALRVVMHVAYAVTKDDAFAALKPAVVTP
ncbi:phage major capsid protein [Jeotgalibacillus malaysiensis]|uniref:phage major capsid protein n=1 Tax=Jeotgalibacillus malaysiensis TaxID=1508404 RepID=UPI00384D216F